MPPRHAAALCPYARGVRFDAPAANSRRRLVPALAVLAAHALLLALWLQTRGPLPPPAAEAVAWLRLVEPATPAIGSAEPAEPGEQATTRPRTARPTIGRFSTPLASR